MNGLRSYGLLGALAASGAAAVFATPAAGAVAQPQYTAGAPILYGTGDATPSSVQLVDVNGDGNLDIVSTSRTGEVVIRYGDGNGGVPTTFRLSTVFPVPEAAAVFDFNGDGRKDLVVVGDGSVWAIPQNADGTFGVHRGPFFLAPAPIASVSQGTGIATGDVNEDGHEDVVVATIGSGDLLFLGTGSGFQPGTQVAPSSSNDGKVALADVNGDGHLDLIANNAHDTPSEAGIDVRFGNGGGTFGAPVAEPQVELLYQDLAVGDLNGDGVDDIAIAGAGYLEGEFVTVLFGHRDGTFTIERLGGFSRETSAPRIVLADLNGDGNTDILASEGGPSLRTFLNDGTGHFVAGATLEAGYYSQLAAGVMRSGQLPDLYAAAAFDSAFRVFVSSTPLDTTPPVVTVPANIVLEATSAAGAAASFSASAVDDVDGSLTPACKPVSGSTFPLGTTKVTCTATDNAGNTASPSFTVTVQDTTPPMLTLPAAIATDATSPAGASVPFTATATDIVDGTVPATCMPASGSVFSAGDTTVNCEATDAHGNTANGQFAVHVRGAGEQIDAAAAAVQGIGPGSSLAAKAAQIQAGYAAGDTATTCTLLAAFEHEISAQASKHVPTATAAELTGDADRIRAVLAC